MIKKIIIYFIISIIIPITLTATFILILNGLDYYKMQKVKKEGSFCVLVCKCIKGRNSRLKNA